LSFYVHKGLVVYSNESSRVAPADLDPQYFGKLEPDPHESEKLDPGPDPHCRPVVAGLQHFDEEQDPDLDPDQH
jgi:hypothetical protein